MVKIKAFLFISGPFLPQYSPPLFEGKRPFSQAVATNMFLVLHDNNSLGFRDMRAVVVKIWYFYQFKISLKIIVSIHLLF